MELFKTNLPALCCAMLASITTGGTTYAFGLYGNALKKTLRLSQSQLDTISTANFCAGLLSWIPGLLVDRYGTRFGICTGGSLGAMALMWYWNVAKGHITFKDKETIVAILSALGVTIFLSCALVTGSVFKIIVANCGPGTKGSAVGVAKGYVGLGAGAYACLFEAIRQPTTSDLDFLPMAAFFFVVCATIPSSLLLPTKAQEDLSDRVADVATPLHFHILYTSLIVLATLIVVNSLDTLYYHKPSNNNNSNSNILNDITMPSNTDYPMALFILFVWIAPIVALPCLPRKERNPLGVPSDSQEEEQGALLENGANEENVHDVLVISSNKNMKAQNKLSLRGDVSLAQITNQYGFVHANSFDDDDDDDDDDDRVEGGVALDDRFSDADRDNQANSPRMDPTDNLNLYQMLKSPSAWLMLWTTTILVGGGTVETNNMGQMVASLRFADNVTPAALAMFSVAQAIGRVLTGSMSEAALNWNTRGRCCIDQGVPRPFFLILASLTAVVAHTILAASTKEEPFIMGVAMCGFAFGMVWPLMVLIVGEVFGTAHVASNYLFFDGTTSALGTLLLSKVVAQDVYERHIDTHYSERSDGVTCWGPECFRLTHVIITLLSWTCVATSVCMVYSSRHSYNKRPARRTITSLAQNR